MTQKIYNVLFLCTRNSARSIMAEAILNKEAKGKFRAYSAGSQPKGAPHPEALRTLRWLGYDTAELRSKSWNEFTRPGAPSFDFIFTVCDNAAGEACPVWLGHPSTAHWGIADPAAVEGSQAEIATAFNDAYRMLHRRITTFAALPLAKLDQVALKAKLRDIGRMEGATAKARESE